MTRKQLDTGIHSYLTAVGVLASGDEAEIARHKKMYWNEYKRKWRKARDGKGYKIHFSPSELEEILSAAKQNCVSPTRYIKGGSLASSRNQIFVPNQSQLNEIIQLLRLTYMAVKQLGNTTVEEQVARMERELMRVLYSSDKSSGL